MSPRLTLRFAARTDVAQAAHWYEAQRSGLGIEFLNELDRLLARVAENPLQFPEIEVGVRRGLLRRFPFGVYFLTRADRIEVIAVLHLHRKPGIWKGRA
ncbi:MAG: type II toxin-antitoxin system RelE/ParE family toxin [Bacillota bacterium]